MEQILAAPQTFTNAWGWTDLDLGPKGEYLTYRALEGVKGRKRFLFNCYIPIKTGYWSEIDLIMLHRSGVYVFECKNYSGWISGSEADEYWTQKFQNGHTGDFKSPIIQNKSHIRWLRRFLPKLSEKAVYSVIVFGERCELERITLTTGRHIVVKSDRLLNAIRPTLGRRMLTRREIRRLYQRLYPQTQLTPQEKQRHRDNVQAIKEGRLCPWCYSEMVPRTARNTGHQFMGCKSFPACKYTAKLPSECLERQPCDHLCFPY